MVRKYLRLPDASEVAVEGRSFTLNKYRKETLIDILSQIGVYGVSNLKKSELISLLIEKLTSRQMYDILRCNGHSSVRTDLGKPVLQIILTTEQPMHYYGKKRPAIPKYCQAPKESTSSKKLKSPSPKKPASVNLPSPKKPASAMVRHGPPPFEREEPLPVPSLLPPSPVLIRRSSTKIPVVSKAFIPRVKDHICMGCYRFSDILELVKSRGFHPPTGTDKSDLIKIISTKFSKSDLVALLKANGVKDASVHDSLVKLRSQLSGGKFGQVCNVCELNTLAGKHYQLKLVIP
jgi:hypothetical protein